MTDADRQARKTLARLLRRDWGTVTAAALAAAQATSVASARTQLANLSRERYYDARPLLSGGVHSDGSLFGPSQGLERRAWAERLENGGYRLSEDGWFWQLRDELGVGSDSDELSSMARACYKRTCGEQSLVTPAEL